MAGRRQRAKDTPDDPIESPAEPLIADALPAVGAAPPEASGDGEQQKKWADPVGRHSIDLGDGRRLHFSRSNRWQQTRIEFVALRDDVDVRPGPEDTAFMKQHGFRWRSEEKAWTCQLGKNTPEDPYARANSDRAAEAAFVELANNIRQRNGLEPTSYSFGQDQGRQA